MLRAVVLAFLLCGSLSNAYTLQHANACYGSRASDLMTVGCDGRYRFAIGNIKVGAKTNTSECRTPDSDIHPNEITCCRYAVGDGCYFDYRPTIDDDYAIFDSQIGNMAINITPQCMAVYNRCSDEFLENTNYMTLDYYCVPFDSPIEVSTHATRSGREVFLMSQNYPNATFAPPHSFQQMCSVTTECYDVIRVSVFHFNFSDIGATFINFLDPSQNRTFRSITNNTFSRFVQMNFVTSSSNFMQLHISVEGANHPFLLGFDSENGNDVVLSCGTAAAHTAPFCPTTTFATTTTEQSANEREQSANERDSEISSGTIAGIVAGVLLALVVVLIVVAAWRKYKKKRARVEANQYPSGSQPSQPGGAPPMSTFPETPRPHTGRSNKVFPT